MELFEKTQQPAFCLLPPATLDETGAPRFSVLRRVTEGRELSGKIEGTPVGWNWSYELDLQEGHYCRNGSASSYEGARQALLESLTAHHVRLRLWRELEPGEDLLIRNER